MVYDALDTQTLLCSTESIGYLLVLYLRWIC